VQGFKVARLQGCKALGPRVGRVHGSWPMFEIGEPASGLTPPPLSRSISPPTDRSALSSGVCRPFCYPVRTYSQGL